MKFTSIEDRFIYELRVERWVVNGSFDDALELKLTPDHSRLRIRAKIEKMPDNHYKTTTTVYVSGGKRIRETKHSPDRLRAMLYFGRVVELAAIYIDGYTNDPRLLKIYGKYKVK